MSTTDWNRVERIIDQVLDLPRDQWDSFIEQKIGDDRQLKTEVKQMLEAILCSEGWLEEPTEYKKDFYRQISNDADDTATDVTYVGTEIGSYTLKEKIGRGGMGTVYLAERTDGEFEHRVAVKVVHGSRASEENLKRFQREQRILASLNHPNIARLFDGGTIDDGSPYIIMEYVEGTPIDQFCKKRDCSTSDKIELFTQVLEAVRHAHENLVIHRDLKPGNILVDDQSKVKILDFGIAKLLDDNKQSGSLTQAASRLLTPKYAAPEQLLQKNITTATDLYALGIVFYELITGYHPFDSGNLSPYELEQTVLNEEPALPSTVAENAELKEKLKGDLDSIALKAIRKEPDSRYRVANEFLNDLSNYQSQLPVAAHKDSFKYRLRKFAKRNKAMVVSTIGILCLILLFSGFYTWRITNERNQARLEARRAEAVTNFLKNIFKANNPALSSGQEISAYELLEQGREKIDDVENEKIKAEMLKVIGEAYLDLGFTDRAITLLDHALKITEKIHGPRSAEYGEVLLARGNISASTYDYDLALPYHRKAHEILTDKLKPENSNIIDAMQAFGESLRYSNKLDSAENVIRQSLSLQQRYHPDKIADLRQTKGILALILRKQNKLNDSEALYLEIIRNSNPENARDSLELASYQHNLAFIYIDRNDYEKAENHLRKSLGINEAIRGQGHSTTLRIRSNIVGILREQNITDEAINMLHESIKYTIDKYSVEHWQTAKKYGYLGYILTENGRLEEGAKYLIKSARIYEKTLGPDHTWTAIAWQKAAANLYFQKKIEAADSLFSTHFEILEKRSDDLRPVNKDQIESIIKMYRARESDYSGIINRFSALLN